MTIPMTITSGEVAKLAHEAGLKCTVYIGSGSYETTDEIREFFIKPERRIRDSTEKAKAPSAKDVLSLVAEVLGGSKSKEER